MDMYGVVNSYSSIDKLRNIVIQRLNDQQELIGLIYFINKTDPILEVQEYRRKIAEASDLIGRLLGTVFRVNERGAEFYVSDLELV